MNIDGQRRRNACVAENFCEGFYIESRLHASGRECVPQGMKGSRRNSVCLQKRSVPPIKDLRFAVLLVSGQQVTGGRLLSFPQILDQEVLHGNRSHAVVRLGGTGDHLGFMRCAGSEVFDAFDSSSHMNQAVFEIDVLPAQTAQLPDPKTCE